MRMGGKTNQNPQNDLGQSAASAGGSESSLFISTCSLAVVAAAFQRVHCCNLLPWRRGRWGGGGGGVSKLRHWGSNKRMDKVLFARC